MNTVDQSIELFYEEKGEKSPLILLHGNGESHEYFAGQVEEFSKHFRVIALDTRGHGKSPRGTAPFSIAQFAEDLHDFMLKKSILRASLLGFSDGGNIALTFALKYPEMVKQLILNGANLCPAGVKRRYQIPIEIDYHFSKLLGGKSTETLALMVNEPNIRPEELQKIKCRTLVIVGTKDMITPQHSKLIFQSLPNAEFAEIRGSHFVAHENPNEFNRAVLKFLGK